MNKDYRNTLIAGAGIVLSVLTIDSWLETREFKKKLTKVEGGIADRINLDISDSVIEAAIAKKAGEIVGKVADRIVKDVDNELRSKVKTAVESSVHLSRNKVDEEVREALTKKVQMIDIKDIKNAVMEETIKKLLSNFNLSKISNLYSNNGNDYKMKLLEMLQDANDAGDWYAANRVMELLKKEQ